MYAGRAGAADRLCATTDCSQSSVSSGAAAAGAGRFSVEAVATQVAAKAAGARLESRELL